MTWQKPDTDEEWRDALSAYLDNELGPEDRAGLEAALKQEPRWACELAELRWVRTTLQSWTVDAPESARRELIQNLQKQPAVPTKVAQSDPRRGNFRVAFASFAGGVALGAVAMMALMVSLPNSNLPAPNMSNVSSPEVRVSEAQADAILREVAAGKLKQAVLKHQQERNWSAAEQAFGELQRDFAGSVALRELEYSDALRPLARYRATSERKDNDV